MKKVNSAEKGYVLAMTVAITTVVTILLGTVFTTSIIATNSSKTLSNNNAIRRQIKNDAYIACGIIKEDLTSAETNLVSATTFEICTYIPDSFNSETNSLQIQYKNLIADIKYHATTIVPTSIVIHR